MFRLYDVAIYKSFPIWQGNFSLFYSVEYCGGAKVFFSGTVVYLCGKARVSKAPEVFCLAFHDDSRVVSGIFVNFIGSVTEGSFNTYGKLVNSPVA